MTTKRLIIFFEGTKFLARKRKIGSSLLQQLLSFLHAGKTLELHFTGTFVWLKKVSIMAVDPGNFSSNSWIE